MSGDLDQYLEYMRDKEAYEAAQEADDARFRSTAVIDYTNWRGERSHRHIAPIRVEFSANEWHREPCWLLVARDLDKGEERAFAMASIHAWAERGYNEQER